MNPSPLRLKNASGWFAAGLEVQQAMDALSDGAFKLFMFLCLNARRDSGIFRTTQTELGRQLKKSLGTVRRLLREMEAVGIICQSRFTNSPVERGTVQIAPPYWPYESGAALPADDHAGDGFVSEVKKALAERSCVRPSFSTADELLARQWFSRGVPIERVRQAILLGCSRKYVSWRNHQARAPISSLAYFDPVLDEVGEQNIADDYWEYLQLRIQRHEKLWIQSHRKKQGTTRNEVTSHSVDPTAPDDITPAAGQPST